MAHKSANAAVPAGPRRRAPGRAPAWFLIPALVLYGFVVLLPSVQGTAFAFTDWDGLDPSRHFVGLANFHEHAVVAGAVYGGLQVPFATFLYLGFLRVVPREYEEAALFYGGGPLQVFWRVVFPLLRPVTGTVVILNAIFIRNDFLAPFLYLSGSDQQTIPVAIFGFLGQYVSEWNLVFAGLVLAMAPILIVYFLMQRHIIKGFAGGLKG